MVLRPTAMLPRDDSATDSPRILLADDTAEVWTVAKKALVAAGMKVVICEDGQSVLNTTSEGGFDLIILDSTLPDMSGVELCHRLTLSPQLVGTPILLFKADGYNENKLEILEVGAFDFIHLPLDPQELVIRAKAALRFKALRDELKAKSHELIHEHEAAAQLERTIQRVRESWGDLQGHQMLGFVTRHLVAKMDSPLTEAAERTHVLSTSTELTPELQEQLHCLARELRESAAHIHRLFGLAQQNGAVREIGLAAMLQDLVNLTRFETETLGLELELETGCRWCGSADQLKHALLLLFQNAVEAVACRDNPRIFIALKSEPPWYRIEITDNGPGLDVSIRSRLFEPFHTTKATPHVGMGIHFAHQAITQLGGQIEFTDAVPAPGTKVAVILPQNREP
ncbi:MAG: response regulator [Pedosphaera sp.]|nr:response regulator [Pedosphaera sp.]